MHEKEVHYTVCSTLLESHLETHTNTHCLYYQKHGETTKLAAGHTETSAVIKITIKQTIHKENNRETTKAQGESRAVSRPADTWMAWL